MRRRAASSDPGAVRAGAPLPRCHHATNITADVSEQKTPRQPSVRDRPVDVLHPLYCTYIIPYYCTTEHHCSASAAPPRQENRQRARDQAPPGRLPAKKVERVVENRGVAGDAATHDASRLQRPPKFPVSVNSRSADFFFLCPFATRRVVVLRGGGFAAKWGRDRRSAGGPPRCTAR